MALEGSLDQSNLPPIVSSIYIYPIKSCKGISVPHALISSTGFEWDREWMVVSDTGRMLTQRVAPKLALIEVSLPPEALTSKRGQLCSEASLSVTTPAMDWLRIPLNNEKYQENEIEVSVWEWRGLAIDEGPDAARWFSRFLQKPCRLVRFNKVGSARSTDRDYADGYHTTFTDGYPFHLISQASLEALNGYLEKPLPMNRFRPNIIVEGSMPFAEDYWKTFLIGGLRFHGVKLCSRCKVTTTDQETGEVGSEPLAMLRTFRSGQALSSLKHMKNQVYFGQNVVYEDHLFTSSDVYPIVAVGDAIHVLEEASAISMLMSKK